MNINQAREYIFAMLRKNQIGAIPEDKFNTYLRQAQMEKVESLRKQYELTSIISDELAPLIAIKEGAPVSNRFTKPTDYLYYTNLESFIFQNPEDCEDPKSKPTVNWVDIKFVSHSQKNYFLFSQIVAPTVYYPIAINYSTYFEIWPKIQQIKLTYVRKPLDPAWVSTPINNNPVYAPAQSQDWELPETTHQELCNIVLTYFGISTRDAELYQPAQIAVQKGESL